MSKFSGTTHFKVEYDDGVKIYIDDNNKVDDIGRYGVFSETFNDNLAINKYYTVYILYKQGGTYFKLILYWSNTGTGMVEIPMSNIFLPTLVGSSPYNITIVTEICGDSRKTGTESWDDGNLFVNDGWSSAWSIETGWTCSGGSSTSKDTCSEICGDGKRFTLVSTYCDDGNTKNGDGWNSIWTKETGWTWSGGNSSTKDTWSELCGDGKRFNSVSTYCDDGNSLNGDGWSSTCLVETGFFWSGGNSSTKDAWSEIWGDSKRYSSLSTSWDDGNKSNNDGWSSSWNIETGWTWSGGSSHSKDTCTEICGDGIKFNSNSSYWDDGNSSSSDGWDSSWNIEAGWSWAGGSSSTKDVWNEICGDAKRFNSLSTYCDDGNTSSNDGWDLNWSNETGWNWSGGSKTTKDAWFEIWGDGIKFNSNSTYWDDGNKGDSDGWSSNWVIETGWICSGGNSSTKDTWSEVWGDGVRFNSVSTYCDDGNTSDNDGCNSNWSIETGWVCSGESSSTKDTWTEMCGDGKRFNSVSTYWDDGNALSGDGWSSTCSIETGWTWSGGSSSTKDSWTEICGDGKRFNNNLSYWDDGNLLDNDGWSSLCNTETKWKWSGRNTTTKDQWNRIPNQGIILIIFYRYVSSWTNSFWSSHCYCIIIFIMKLVNSNRTVDYNESVSNDSFTTSHK